MSAIHLTLLVAVSFLASVVSVVNGSTSLILVPLMIGLGIRSHVAVSTNMLALTLMSAGGSAPFVGKGVIRRDYLPVSLVLTAVGSALGALLLLRIDARPLQITIGVAMVLAAVLTLANHGLGTVGEGVAGVARGFPAGCGVCAGVSAGDLWRLL